MTAYEMLISDWSSDVCSSDLVSGRDHIRLPFTIGVAYETPPETLARLPAILTELVEAEGAKAARAGFDSFGPSSLDFALLVDVPGRDWSIAHPIRDRLLVAIIKRFAAEGIAIPYPTQIGRAHV